MTATKTSRMHRLPKIGAKVTATPKAAAGFAYADKAGRVIDVIFGACGPIVAVEFPGYGVVDLFWKKVRAT